jgi:hypothetical protein
MTANGNLGRGAAAAHHRADRHDVETRDGARSVLYFDVSLPLSRVPFSPPPR